MMNCGKMDMNSNSSFENFTGQQNLESVEEGAKDDSVEVNMEVVLDHCVRKYFYQTFLSGLINRKTLSGI